MAEVFESSDVMRIRRKLLKSNCNFSYCKLYFIKARPFQGGVSSSNLGKVAFVAAMIIPSVDSHYSDYGLLWTNGILFSSRGGIFA